MYKYKQKDKNGEEKRENKLLKGEKRLCGVKTRLRDITPTDFISILAAELKHSLHTSCCPQHASYSSRLLALVPLIWGQRGLSDSGFTAEVVLTQSTMCEYSHKEHCTTKIKTKIW